MGKPAARLEDIGSGHGCHHPPSPAIEGSPNVVINGLPAVRLGDSFAMHACPAHGGLHPRALATGSSSVIINGKPAGRLGDSIDCGGAVMTGSANVLIGEDAFGGSRQPFRQKCPYAQNSNSDHGN